MKLFPEIRPTAALAVMLLTVFALLRFSAFGQETTGTVTGVVQDTTGALVPGATVVLTNLSNKSERRTVSNETGHFVMASVSSALQYRLLVSMSGFKTWQSLPFALRPGDQIGFTDIRMQVAEAATEQVTVEATASQAVKPLDVPERSDVITAKDLETLAIEGRDATELIRMLPGFTMVSPGVNNTSAANSAVVGMSGPSNAFSSNGTGERGIAIVLDGVSLTDIGSNSGSVQQVNQDMVEEIKASTSTFSAENAKGPTVLNATTKAGTTSFHGSAYLYARDTSLNANDWYNNYLQQTRPDGRYFYPGGTIGGPLWIPGTRFTKNNTKLFFFAGFEYYSQRYWAETLGSWVPTMAERNGDFTVASLNSQLCGARPDGNVNPNAIQPMCYAMNFMPSGLLINNGDVSAFKNPSGVALVNWLPLPNADPFVNSSGYNYVQPIIQEQNGNQFHARLDYVLNDNNKLFITYGRQSQITQQPVSWGGAPNYAAAFPGDVSSGDISNTLSANYTHVFSGALTNQLSAAMSFITSPGNEGNPAAVYRFDMNSYNCTDPKKRASGTCGTSGFGNFNYLGEYKNAGDYSVPALSDYGELGYPNMAMPGGFYGNNVHMKKVVPDVQDAISWAHGPHLFSIGAYFEKGILNGLADFGAYPQGQYTFNPGNAYYQYSSPVGQAANWISCVNPNSLGTTRLSGAAYFGECINPIAMMYTGYADSYQQTNFSPIVDMQYTTLAGYINDSWKIHRVTLMLGARGEHLGPWSDRHNNGLATFSPALYNQQCTDTYRRNCSAQNMPGLTWSSIDKSVSNTVSSPDKAYFTPRVGAAWDIFGTGNTVLRGGWGVYRNEEEFAPYALAAATAQGYKTTYKQQEWNFDLVDSQSPINPPDFSVYTLSASDSKRPIYYEYNLAVSQRMKWRSLVEVAYVGNNNKNLSTYNQGSNYNGVSDLNLIPAGQLFNVDNQCLSCYIPSDLTSTTSGSSLASLTTPQQDVFRPYPFFQHIYALRHEYYSNYNSMQAAWNKSAGMLQFGANYTFSKTLATAASWNNIVPDPINLRNEYNPAPFDRTQVFNIHYMVDLGKRYSGGNRLLGEIANHWQISGISTVESGPNLASEEGENFSFGYGTIQPVQLWAQVQFLPTDSNQCTGVYNIPADKNGNRFCTTQMNSITWLGSPDYQLMPTVTCNPSGGPNKHQYINPTCFGVPMPGSPTTGPYALSANFSGQGQYRLPYIHGPAYQTHDLTVLKTFTLHERGTLTLRAAAFNFLNHPLVSFNNNDTTNLNLGNLYGAVAGKALTVPELRQQNFGIANVKYGARLMELSAKYQF